MACVITDLVVKFDLTNTPEGIPLSKVVAAPSQNPLFIKVSSIFRETGPTPARLMSTNSIGQWSVTLPWPSEQDPALTNWTITLPDNSVWMGLVPEGIAGPLTLHDLKVTYGWGLVTARTPPVPPVAIAGLPGPAGPSGSGLPAFSGLNGAAVMEVEPGATAIFRRISLDDIDPAFSITGFSGGGGSVELGTIVTHPSFVASYSAALSLATINDGSGTLTITLPATSFAYDGGASGLPARTYQKTTVNGQQSWTLSATKSPAGPTKAAMISDNLGLTRRYFDIVAVPGAYDQAFITSLGNNQLASGFGGTYAFGAGAAFKKIYLCWPTAFGSPSSILGPSPFVFPMVRVATAVPFTNTVGGGFVIPGGYDVWESSNFIVSPFTLVVS